MTLTYAIREGFIYARRAEHGIQEPVATVRMGRGSCRDFASRLGCATRLGLFCQNNRFSCKISRYLYGLSRSQSRPWRLMAFGFVLPKRSYKS